MSATQRQPGFDIKAFAARLTAKPGVYRMLNADGEVLYVGKAANLRKRVSSYARATGQGAKTLALLAHTHRMEVTVTRTEGEALLLENNLIKAHRPRYNILLRDDKSYPYIYVSIEQPFPRLGFYRGTRRGPGRYFGPYPSAGAVRETLNLLQKLFPVRQCEDGFFRNRTRPCLQYQIKRCTAPCVDLVSAQAYAEDVRHAIMFLEGKSAAVVDEMVRRMEAAAAALRFEDAARYRDQIARLRRVQERQYVSGGYSDEDVIAVVLQHGVACVQVFMIRGGRNLGNKTLWPRHPEVTDPAEILAAFIPQYYLEREVPARIVVNQPLAEADLLESVLSEQAGRRVKLAQRVRGERAQWLRMAETNAEQALKQHLASRASLRQRFEALQDALGLDSQPLRMECFDISHTMGEATVASCVVFDSNGPVKSDYRRYNIEGITPGDDFAALQQAVLRRYTRLKEGEGKLPDVLFIDGGKGQVGQVGKVLEELQIGGILLMGVAKGPSRKPGLEQLFLLGRKQPIILPADSPALHLIQFIRDEAHRFAITGHRQRRARKRRTSVLEEIPGMGPKRRQLLLKQFGGLQGVARAGKDELARIKGISRPLAERIFDAFHHDDS